MSWMGGTLEVVTSAITGTPTRSGTIAPRTARRRHGLAVTLAKAAAPARAMPNTTPIRTASTSSPKPASGGRTRKCAASGPIARKDRITKVGTSQRRSMKGSLLARDSTLWQAWGGESAVTHDHGTHAHAGGHDHGHAHVSESTALSRAFVLTAVMLVVEGVGGLLIGSVALIADAGHMLTDVGALGIALFAAWAAAQPRGRRHSFGYGRAEVLAALLNGFLLGGVSVGIAGESIARLHAPRAIDPGPMIGIAALGLVANLLSGFFLLRGAR